MLSAKQKRFCLEYIKDSNATQAAVRAGYSKHAAKQQGTRLMSYASIKEELRILSAQVASSKIMTASEVLEALSDLAKTAAKQTDKIAALDKLGKHHKLFTELHETQHTFTQMPSIKRNGKAVQFEVGEPKPDR